MADKKEEKEEKMVEPITRFEGGMFNAPMPEPEEPEVEPQEESKKSTKK